MLSSLAIAAGTDYAIFLIGRYQEARQAGEDRETAYYSMFRGTSHIILGSGLTIAGATFCLHLARLAYFRALGIPSALGLLVVVAGALTAAPAIVAVASRFGLLDPKRTVKRPRLASHRHRDGAMARRRCSPPPWRSPSSASPIMPSMKISYNDRYYIPDELPSNVGYAAAERHFSSATMNPDILMIKSDHDMRNSGDMIILDKIATEVFRTPGIAMVQSITRPLGGPVDHTSIPFQISAQSIPIPAKPSIHEGPGGRHAHDERRPRRDDRLHGAHGRPRPTDERRHPPHGRRHGHHEGDAGRHPRSPRRFRRRRQARAQLPVLGTALPQHSRLLGRRNRCSSRSTASTNSART